MSDNLNVFIRSILAGICIGLGGAIFVKLGGFIGAFMFAFGLLSVVHFKLPLYTGTAGFIELNKWQEYKKNGNYSFRQYFWMFYISTIT